MEKNVNKIPARVRPGRGQIIAGLSSRNRAERGVKGCVLACLLVEALLGVLEGLVAAISPEPAWVHYRCHEALQLPIAEVANGLAAAPALLVDAALVFSPSWQLRRCYNPWPSFHSPLLHLFALVWPTSWQYHWWGVYMQAWGSQAVYRMEPEELWITPSRPLGAMRLNTYTTKKWNINMRTCICDFIRCWPDSQLPRWELHVRVNVNACKFSSCAMHAKPKPPKVCMRACRHTCKMAISLLSHLNGNIKTAWDSKQKNACNGPIFMRWALKNSVIGCANNFSASTLMILT